MDKMRYFVDSNVFLSYYSKDDREQSNAAAEIFLRAQNGEIELFCGHPVFFEVAWVLRSYYKLNNNVILDILESMLLIPNMTVMDSAFIMNAISLSRTSGQSFADCYIASVSSNYGVGVATFNIKHFSKLGVQLYPTRTA